jgi:hypothetical protein
MSPVPQEWHCFVPPQGLRNKFASLLSLHFYKIISKSPGVLRFFFTFTLHFSQNQQIYKRPLKETGFRMFFIEILLAVKLTLTAIFEFDSGICNIWVSLITETPLALIF